MGILTGLFKDDEKLRGWEMIDLIEVVNNHDWKFFDHIGWICFARVCEVMAIGGGDDQ